MKRCGRQFLNKDFIAPRRNGFSDWLETVFSICQIFLAVKTVFQSSGSVFFNEFFIPASVRALLKFLKFGGSNFFKEKPYSYSLKMIFWPVEANFLHFSDTPTGERYFSSSGNVFLNEFYIPYGGD